MRPLSRRMKRVVFYGICAVIVIANVMANEERMWPLFVAVAGVWILIAWVMMEDLMAELEHIAKKSLERIAKEAEDAPAL